MSRPAHAVSVAFGHAYVTDDDLRVVDVRTPSDPTEIGFYSAPDERAGGTAISWRWAYVTDECALRVLEVTIPSSPKEVGFYGWPCDAFYPRPNIAASTRFAYVSKRWQGFVVLRFTGPMTGLHQSYIPLALRHWAVGWESEPNNEAQTQANGPILSGLTYKGYFHNGADLKDYFYFDLASSRSVELWLGNIGAGHDYDLVLRDGALKEVGRSASRESPTEHILTGVLSAGRYYVQVYNYGRTGSSQPYHLRVVYE
jgi:hypothetical protein